MDPQHGFQRIRRATALGAGFGLVGLNQINQRLQWHNDLHLREETFAAGAFFLPWSARIQSPKPSRLLPINPVHTCNQRPIFA
jgi:hypothetical protein